MRSLIVITCKLVLVFFLSLAALSCFADQGAVRPINQISFNFKAVARLDSMLTTGVQLIAVGNVSELSAQERAESAGKICSCQVLNLESSNYNHRYVVLLAEKTNDGSGTVYDVAKNRIQKEKKQMKKMFYDKVKVVAELQGTGSCKAMFFQLRTADRNLKLYEILNADIH